MHDREAFLAAVAAAGGRGGEREMFGKEESKARKTGTGRGGKEERRKGGEKIHEQEWEGKWNGMEKR